MENGFRRRTDSLPTCMNCGSVLYGGFCSHCGQQSTDEITFKGIFQELWRRCVELDHPWLRTPVELTRNPGRVVRGYLRGRRLPYVGPFAYAFFTTSLLAVLVNWLSFDLSSPNTPWGRQPLADPSIPVFVFGCFSMFWVAALVAWLQRALYRQERYSVTQTWIFNLYVFGHLAILQAVFVALGALASDTGLMALSVALILGLVSALSSFYRRPLWATLPAALILGTVYIGGVLISAALFRRLFF